MRPIVFPKWPERALSILGIAAALMVGGLAIQAWGNFDGEVALTVVAGGVRAVLSFAGLAYLVRLHRLKTESRAFQYDKVISGLAYNG